MKLLSINVRDCEVSHVQIAHRPARRIYGMASHANAKEGQLITEAPPIARLHVARVIPPLQAIVRVRRVIAWELVTIAGFGLAPFTFTYYLKSRLLLAFWKKA